MVIVVIVQRGQEEAERYISWLQGEGYTFLTCGGPGAERGAGAADESGQAGVMARYTCQFWREGRCAYWEVGDLFVYDAWLDKSRSEANSDELVAHLRRRYPSRPLVLVGPNAITPTWVERLTRADPLVRAVFPANREGLRQAVAALLERARASATPELPEPGLEGAPDDPKEVGDTPAGARAAGPHAPARRAGYQEPSAGG